MTRYEAMRLISDYYYNDNPTDEDKFLFVEAQLFLIHTYHNPKDMHNLAWFYLEERRFDLEVKYLEMAAALGHISSIEELGYIWYYGQNGVVDYRKAYECFSQGVESGNEITAICCGYKLADMYHYGYYVRKSEVKYSLMIKDIFARVSDPDGNCLMTIAYPDVAYRMAGILVEEGRKTKAYRILKEATRILSEAIRDNPNWWGNIELMDYIVTLMHEVEPRSEDMRLSVYDLFWIWKMPCKMAFLYDGRRFVIEVEPDEDGNVIRFEGKWYRNARDFFEKAQIDGKKIVYLYDELFDMEVQYG
ncbi:MAG: sel1 repeat family protein [Clostridiales bacterium]|nr:sel1 repeat family protein [Clostridiales bacterium]